MINNDNENTNQSGSVAGMVCISATAVCFSPFSGPAGSLYIFFSSLQASFGSSSHQSFTRLPSLGFSFPPSLNSSFFTPIPINFSKMAAAVPPRFHTETAKIHEKNSIIQRAAEWNVKPYISTTHNKTHKQQGENNSFPTALTNTDICEMIHFVFFGDLLERKSVCSVWCLTDRVAAVYEMERIYYRRDKCRTLPTFTCIHTREKAEKWCSSVF